MNPFTPPLRIARLGCALALAGACQVEPPGAVPPDKGGQSGTAQPDGCVEDSRTTVLDPTVAADGFDFTAAEAIAPLEGVWSADATLAGDGGGDAAVTASVAWDGGVIEAVLSHLEERDDGAMGVGAPTGAPGETCPPAYSVGFTLDVGAAPILAVGGAAEVALRNDGYAEVPIEVDVSEVQGDLQPPVWDNPELWDRTALSAVFQRAPGEETASLSLTWWAINDDPVQSSNTTVTANGGTVMTGVVEPSGTSAPIAYITGMTRPPAR